MLKEVLLLMIIVYIFQYLCSEIQNKWNWKYYITGMHMHYQTAICIISYDCPRTTWRRAISKAMKDAFLQSPTLNTIYELYTHIIKVYYLVFQY